MEPHLETAVITVIRELILNGLNGQGFRSVVPLEMTAATLAWAIYGGAREWSDTPQRPSSERAAAAIATLLKPVLLTSAENASTKR